MHWEATTPDHNFFIQPVNSGELRKYSYREAGNEIRRMATALKSFGFEPQSKIALLSKNCAHWIMADLAIMMAGYISVPLYPTLHGDDIRPILVHSESKAIFAFKLDLWEDQKKGVPDIPVIGVEAFGTREQYTWEGLIASHEPMQNPQPQLPDNLVTIIYTSGTTGTPKGVMHSVGAFATIANVFVQIVQLPENPRLFSYLPLSHIAERIGISMHAIFRGASVRFPQSIESFPADLAATQPHLFFAVPRIWAKFQEKILEKMPQKKLDLFLKIPILKGVIRKKIQKALGLGSATYIAAGAAPIAVSLLDWFEKLDIHILQVYGMTEDCVHSHFNLPGQNKKGTVGKSLPGSEGKLSPEGEILVRTKALMKGYYKEPALSAESFTEDGFLRTGDMGQYDSEGYLTIIGRFKDQFKTDKAKFISPAPMELELMKNHDVEQVCVVGTGLPQPIALITLAADSRQKPWEELTASLTATLKEVNQHLHSYEKITKMVIMQEDWTVDNGLATPTLKIKRNEIERIFRDKYLGWYEQEGVVVKE